MAQDDGIEELNNCSFEVSDTVSRDVEDALENGLAAHIKERQAPEYESIEIALAHRDQTGKIVAALAGKTFWNWLYIDLLWVDEAWRGQGIGSALVKAAEDEAQKRGCTGAYLWTESWQGKDFYPKLGYKEFVVMDDFPIGHQRIGFMKRVAA